MVGTFRLPMLLLVFLLVSTTAGAASLSVFDDWTEIAAEDTTNYKVIPGYGGQTFDAEYLFYKKEGSLLSIGLQTGFDLSDGVQTHTDDKDYFAGDLAISFDGLANGYEYAFDFGLYTEGYYGTSLGTHAEGLYKVSTWNNEVYSGYTVSNPFAMEAGEMAAAVIDNEVGSGYTNVVQAASYFSFYRWVTFDLAQIDDLAFTDLDVHWTMSCGNDAIDGYATAPVPEPSTFMLLGVGGGLLWWMRRKKANS